MAEAALSYLLESLKQLLLNEIHLFSGVSSELKQLQVQLELMKLKILANEGETLAGLDGEIRDAVYDAEDLIDAVVSFEKSRHIWRPIFLKHRSLGKRLSTFREQRLRPLNDRLQKASADASATTSQQPNTQDDRAPLPSKDDVVGFEDEASTLIKCLFQETEGLDVISIIGMGGLGKTTLARKIYHDDTIIKNFPCLIWANASVNMRDVFLDILRKFTKEDMSQLPNALLADIVRNNLKSQRFLIIIDDVHTTQDWRYFEAALPKTNSLGKVLITTRLYQVASEANRNREPHMLRLLDLDESWELLQLEVFGRNNNCPSELEGMGKQIALECKGLPLSLVVIGGILAKQSSQQIELWKKVLNSVSTYIQDDQQKRVEKRISMSCKKLPSHLRACFLYLGLFPQDVEIPEWNLTRLWIAEGFIQQDRGKNLEEVAGDYLNDLVDRSLVEVAKFKANGDMKTFRVPDMIRAFCQNEAAFVNKNLFQEVKKTKQGLFYPALPEIKQHRRICIHSNVVEFLRQKPKGPMVRSFLCFSNESIDLPEEYTQSLFEAFPLIRVLDVHPTIFPKFTLKLAKLILLKYIALSGNEFRTLPDSVYELWNLQTMIINTRSPQFKIKADVWKMMRLRHLKTKATIVLTKEAKGKGGGSLQTLSRLSPQSLTDDLCGRLYNLRNLGICGDLKTLKNTTYLTRLDRLEKLKLVHDTFPDQRPLMGLPDQETFPPNLKILELSSTSLEWKHMSTLGMFHMLEMLKLKDNAFVGSSWKVDGGWFPSLQTLLIECTDLEFWSASEDSFPRLNRLVLKNCEKLEKIPHVLLKSLHVEIIGHVKKSLVDSFIENKEVAQAQPKARNSIIFLDAKVLLSE